MTFEDVLDQALAMLQRRGRATYRTLKLQFQLDDDTLEALKEEILTLQDKVEKLEQALRASHGSLAETVPLFAALLTVLLPESYLPLTLRP